MRKILLIEDEPLLLTLYATVLQRAAYRVLRASEETEAVRLIRRERPLLILLDLMIPTARQRSDVYNFHDPVGYEILKFVRRQTRNTRLMKVVILSNLDSDEHRQRARELGADDFWVKASFDPHELPKRVDAVLRQP